MPKVKDLMTSNPACCTRDTDLKSVASLMCQHNCGEIPVVDSMESKRVIGVITDRDITCRTVAQGKNPLELNCKDAMTDRAVTIKRESELQEAVRLLEQHQIRRLPVVDEEGQLCGIVAQADLARKAPDRQTAEVVKKVSEPAGRR